MYCHICKTYTTHQQDYHRVEMFATLFFFIAFSAIILAAVMWLTTPNLPKCPEDRTLIGQGDFNNGYWTTYTCGPSVDDFTEYNDVLGG